MLYVLHLAGLLTGLLANTKHANITSALLLCMHRCSEEEVWTTFRSAMPSLLPVCADRLPL